MTKMPKNLKEGTKGNFSIKVYDGSKFISSRDYTSLTKAKEAFQTCKQKLFRRSFYLYEKVGNTNRELERHIFSFLTEVTSFDQSLRAIESDSITLTSLLIHFRDIVEVLQMEQNYQGWPPSWVVNHSTVKTCNTKLQELLQKAD